MRVTFQIEVTAEVPEVKPGIVGKLINNIAFSLTSDLGMVKADEVRFISTNVDLRAEGDKNVLQS